MSAVAAGIIGGSAIIGGIGGALISSGAAGKAADEQSQAALQAAQLQANASRYATDAQTAEFNQQQANMQPFLSAGTSVLPQLTSMASTPVSFSQQDFLNNMDPAYQFDLQQGQQALERSAAASGQLMSGGTLKSLTNYAQGMASNEYQNAYNRYMNNQNTTFSRLSSVANIGQSAAGMLGQAGQAYAGNIGNIATSTANSLGNIGMSAGNAQAASTIAQGNILGGAISGAGNSVGGSLLSGSLLNALSPPKISPMVQPSVSSSITPSTMNAGTTMGDFVSGPLLS